MAVRALLGVETIRRHPEHVVALDADAMNYAGAVGQCSVFGGVRRCRRMLSHAGILP
jgi:Ni,Fe-hydrogenase I small subunit